MLTDLCAKLFVSTAIMVTRRRKKPISAPDQHVFIHSIYLINDLNYLIEASIYIFYSNI